MRPGQRAAFVVALLLVAVLARVVSHLVGVDLQAVFVLALVMAGASFLSGPA